MTTHLTIEHQRLADSETRRADWKNWGPYLAERAWGTVREDYSATGEAWDYFPHDHARSRAYRWNEDGIGGFCNRFQNLCMAVALWNGQDSILKERFFGVTGPQGNHGEDVKEYYFYLDGLPSHAYMKMLYKYPQVAYPYDQLIKENRHRGRYDREFELVDALRDAFEESRYFDVLIEYAKADQDDILCRITATNRGPDPAPIHILPHLWHRNNWSWGYGRERPSIEAISENVAIITENRHLGDWWWASSSSDGRKPSLLFTENETNYHQLYGIENPTPYVKDAFHRAIVHGNLYATNLDGHGSKAAAHFQAVVPPGQSFGVTTRFSNSDHLAVYNEYDPFADVPSIFTQRIAEADEFYATIHPANIGEEEKQVQRQAFAGLLWSKQFYHYSVELWLKGDPAQPVPPASRLEGRNADWQHLYALDVLSMPDKWEYPWFAAWDLAFHAVPLALIDPEWAKRQLILLLREWYMHPNGQLAAYEWAFGDVNPPVHAWAAWQVYMLSGRNDTDFLERVFQKLLLNFTWWINRKDHDGNNVFQGGFLGLDNIGVFDRSAPLPTGGIIEQADGTAWMAFYCLNMLRIALELARTRPPYEDVATKFFEHFIYIANAFYQIGLWNEEDGFFYDVLNLDGKLIPMKLRSFVGLLPILAVDALDPDQLEHLPHFRKRMDWFIKYRPELTNHLATLTEKGHMGHHQLAVVSKEKLQRVLDYVFSEEEFLSPYGLRSLSRVHHDHPYQLNLQGRTYSVHYQPAESQTDLFGGNSNWRGPIWLPVSAMTIEALRKYHHHYGNEVTVNLPGHKKPVTLDIAADEIARRVVSLFTRDPQTGHRPFHGGESIFQNDPHWQEGVLFYEYFHGDNGAGLGASHQTGWTALVATLIDELGKGHS